VAIIATVSWPKKLCSNERSIGQFIAVLLLCYGLPILLIILGRIRYYIISREELKYYSFGHPFGKTLYFADYIGKIITTETGSGGSFKMVYLVDKQNRTVFKLNGALYKNFDEIIDAIPLKKISFSPSAGRYFKLLFTGKIKLESADSKPKNRKAERRIRTVIFITVSIGLACFVLSMIVKILSKLM
jgi:hypothetical protein